jgi:hypothetical protein
VFTQTAELGEADKIFKELKRINCLILFLAIGLIIVGGLGYLYYYHGYWLATGCWVGMLVVLTSCCCIEFGHHDKDPQRLAFLIFHGLALAGLGFFLFWHATGISSDQQFYNCNYVYDVLVNCTTCSNETTAPTTPDYELGGCVEISLIDFGDAEFMYPSSISDISKRVGLHAAGISMGVLIVLLMCYKCHKAKKRSEIVPS